MQNQNEKIKLYINKIKNRVPKSLDISPVTKSEIETVNIYLKSRKDLIFKFWELNEHFGENWDYNKYPLGYMMNNKKSKKIVGFMGTIFSRRNLTEKNKICCNLSRWFVEKEYRKFSYALLLPILNNEKIIINATTPVKSLEQFFKKLGFENKNINYTIGFSFNFFCLFKKNFKRFTLSDEGKIISSNLTKDQKQIFYDHKKYNCKQFIILDKKREFKPIFFVAKKTKKKGLKVLDIFYISNRENLIPYAKEIFVKYA